MRYLNNAEDFCNPAGRGHGGGAQTADKNQVIKTDL